MPLASCIRRTAVASLLAFGLAAPVSGQAPDLPLRLVDGRVVSFSAARLDRMARDTVRVTGHSGVSQAYRVLTAYELLLAAGVRVDSVRGPRSTWVLVATAADGFRTAFTLAELAPDLGPSKVLLATATSTGALPPAEGHYRILVPTDRRQGRWARQVVSLAIVDAQVP
jgi:hypothetical protein